VLWVFRSVSLNLWAAEAVVGFAAGGIGQFDRISKLCVKGIALFLCRSILPVGTHRVSECSLLSTVSSSIQLSDQRLSGIQIGQKFLCLLGPENSS
jgi:hypothetical protein